MSSDTSDTYDHFQEAKNDTKCKLLTIKAVANIVSQKYIHSYLRITLKACHIQQQSYCRNLQINCLNPVVKGRSTSWIPNPQGLWNWNYSPPRIYDEESRTCHRTGFSTRRLNTVPLRIKMNFSSFCISKGEKNEEIWNYNWLRI